LTLAVSIHATLLAGWSGTLIFLAIWFGLLARLRSEDPAFGRFALLALFNALALVATAALLGATSAATVTAGRNLQLACFGASAAVLPAVVRDLAPGVTFPDRPAKALAVVFSVLAASGALLEPAPGGGPEANRAVLTPLGLALGAAATAGLGPVLWAPLRAASTMPRVRLVVVTLAFAVGAGMLDLVLRGLGVPSLELGAHSAGLMTLAIGSLTLRRVAHGEEELERASEMLSVSMRELEAAEAALVEARSRASLGELAAVIAHEVRNPLAVLRNAASALRKPTTSSVDVETLVEIIREETRRLDQLGRSLSHFAEPMPYQPRRVALAPLLSDAVSAVKRAHAGASSVTIEVDPGSRPEVSADAALLRQALVNVIDNAVRALPAGGRVEVSAVELGGRIAVRVRDDGEGMTPQVLARAKDPFFTTRATGTGLGLALVDKVMRLHGGELRLAAREPRGVEVTLVLGP
jgi:signal transduction histidine kinase